MTDRGRSREERAWWARIALPAAGLTVLGLLAIIGWLLLRSDPNGLEQITTVDEAGDTIVYSGRVRDAVARARIVEAFNSVPTPGEGDSGGGSASDSARQAATAAARQARQAAVDALARLYATPSDPEAVVAAMNEAIIDFEVGSAELPVDAAGFIQSAAEAIQRTPSGTRIVVAGYAGVASDGAGAGNGEGAPPIDLATASALAAERAGAVVAALVEAGADRAKLGAEARGDGPPEANGASEEGVPRRPISFILAEVGQAEAVDDQSDESPPDSPDPAEDSLDSSSDSPVEGTSD